MQYSNTTTKNGIIQRIERHTELGDGVISGDETTLRQTTADVNETVYDLTTEIMLMQDSFDWDDPYKTDYPIATTPLVADQRDYQFDSISFLKLKRVDITYDGTTWYRATAFDSASLNDPLGNEATIDTLFENSAPQYDPKAFGFWLYPRATTAEVTAGAKARIEYSRGHTEYVYDDTDKEAPIDRPFHDLIAVGASLKNPALTTTQYQKLQVIWQEGKERMIQHYSQRNEDTFLNIGVDLRNNYE